MRSLFTAAVLAGATTAAQVPQISTGISQKNLEAAKFKRCVYDLDFADADLMARVAECQEKSRTLLTTTTAKCTNKASKGEYKLKSEIKKTNWQASIDWKLETKKSSYKFQSG